MSANDDAHPEVACATRECLEHAVATKPLLRLRDPASIDVAVGIPDSDEDLPVPLCLDHFRQQMV